jgi:hypothetical protein
MKARPCFQGVLVVERDGFQGLADGSGSGAFMGGLRAVAAAV